MVAFHVLCLTLHFLIEYSKHKAVEKQFEVPSHVWDCRMPSDGSKFRN